MKSLVNTDIALKSIPHSRWIAPIFATSMFVGIEPAPFDMLMCVWMLMVLPLIKGVTKTSLISLLIMVSVFTVARLITIPAAIDVGASLKFFSITLYLTVLAVILAGYIGRFGGRVIDYIMWGFYIGALVTALLVTTTKAGITPWLGEYVTAYGETRIKGFFKDPNVFGPALILVFLYAWMALQKGLSHKIWHLLMMPVAAILILLSLSRGAWVTFIGASALFYALNLANADPKILVRSLVVVILGLILAIPLTILVLDVTGAGDLIKERLSLQAYDTERFYIHHILVEYVMNNPFGLGPGQSNVYIRSFYANIREANAAHNTYLRVAFENGWAGIIIFALMLLSTFFVGLKECFRKNYLSSYAMIALAGLAASIVSGFTVDTLHWRHLWFEIAMIWGIYAHNRFEREQSSKIV